MRCVALLALGVVACSKFSADTTSTSGGDSGVASTDGGASGVCSSVALAGTHDAPEYADVAWNAAFDETALTVEAWVYVDGTGPDEQHILSHGDYYQCGWVLMLFKGQVVARLYHTGGGWEQYGGTVAAGWHHVAAEFSDKTRQLVVFVDGAPSVGMTAGPQDNCPDVPLRMGAAAVGASFPFQGKLDEVRVLHGGHYALKSFVPPYPFPDDDPATIAVWHLNEGTGDASDAASHDPTLRAAIHGGITGVAWDKTCAKP